MAQAKIILLIDEAMRTEARERMADRHALIALLEQELNELHESMAKLVLRLEIMEAGVPELNAGQETSKAP